MPKVSVLVEIPEGYELACDEMRAPKSGELYLPIGMKNEVSKCFTNFDQCDSRVIVRKKWQWPEWLTANYVAQDHYKNNWYGFNFKPSPIAYGWKVEDDKCYRIPFEIIKLEMPKFDRWQDSLMENPNKKQQ